MQLSLHSFDLKIKHTFTISRGSIDEQPTLIVELRQDGVSGFGEATTNSYYGYSLESMSASLESARSQIENFELADPRDFWKQLNPTLQHDRFAQCAVDEAAFDLWGKLHNKPTYEMLGFSDLSQCPQSDYTIGMDDIDVMISKMKEFYDWPIFKIKLGSEKDLEIVQALRNESDAVFRVDANCGWTPEKTIKNSAVLADLGVEFIEQPLPADDAAGMSQLAGLSKLPLIADESCIEESDVQMCSDQGFDGVNIKLVKCGGMTPALRMIKRARELNLKVMIGCMVESTVGISAIAQLLPLLDYVDMDGAALLTEDIATGVEVRKGICHYPSLAGNGVQLTS